MATTIIKVCDGWDVRTDGGRTFHSLVEREDWQAWIDSLPAPVDTPPTPAETSPSSVELEFQRQRDAAKITAVMYIYKHPDCSEADTVAAAGVACPLLNSSALLDLYIGNCASEGYIESEDFELFKAFILTTPPEILMELT
jgi:hypothetical protein